MSINPKLGLVIRYDFLWKDEQDGGQQDGSKFRACAILDMSKPDETGARTVHLCAISHSPPLQGQTAVELPYKVSRHLGLDEDRSWLKTHEVNALLWREGETPYGVRPARPEAGEWAYGQLPHPVGREAFGQLRENSQAKTLERVRRDELLERYERQVEARREELETAHERDLDQADDD